MSRSSEELVFKFIHFANLSVESDESQGVELLKDGAPCVHHDAPSPSRGLPHGDSVKRGSVISEECTSYLWLNTVVEGEALSSGCELLKSRPCGHCGPRTTPQSLWSDQGGPLLVMNGALLQDKTRSPHPSPSPLDRHHPGPSPLDQHHPAPHPWTNTIPAPHTGAAPSRPLTPGASTLLAPHTGWHCIGNGWVRGSW